MRLILVLLCLTTLTLADSSPSATGATQPVSQDEDKLIGTWKAEIDFPSAGRLERLIITATELISVNPNGTEERSNYQLDSNAQPKRIELSSPRGGNTIGIYEIDGDLVRICLAGAGRDRPESFKSRTDEKGLRSMLLILSQRSPATQPTTFPAANVSKH